jgi:preprotein translocase subunit YajC
MTTSDGGPKPVHTSLTLLNSVLATTTTKKSSGSPVTFLLLIAVFAVVYFGFMRPARNRQRKAATVRRSVEVGDEVTTTAGLIATVVAVDEDFLTLEVAPGVQCRYVPAAILRVNTPDEEPDTSAPDASTHEVIEDPERGAASADPADDLPDESTPA